MTVVEMHVMFRELAQQMGMQTVRAILSEDIDTCINIAVNDYIKKVIADNKIYIDNAKIGQINVLRTLIDKLEISNITINKEENKFTAEINNNNVFLFTSSYIYYNDIFGGFSARIVDNDYLYSTLHDFCNRATFDYPIIVFTDNSDSKTNTIIIDIYTEDNSKDINTHKKPSKVVLNIIKKPNIITYINDTSSSNINCDLPEYTHIDIVKAAAELYLRSVVSTSN
jgi:hypothetical protein